MLATVVMCSFVGIGIMSNFIFVRVTCTFKPSQRLTPNLICSVYGGWVNTGYCLILKVSKCNCSLGYIRPGYYVTMHHFKQIT